MSKTEEQLELLGKLLEENPNNIGLDLLNHKENVSKRFLFNFYFNFFSFLFFCLLFSKIIPIYLIYLNISYFIGYKCNNTNQLKLKE